MGWSPKLTLLFATAAIGLFIGSANGQLNNDLGTLGFNEIDLSFEQSFVQHLIESGAFNREEKFDIEDITERLLKTIQKVSSIRALQNPQEERALMVFFASEISSVIVDNAGSTMSALQQSAAVMNALRQAYIDQGEPPNENFIKEVEFLVGIFLDFKTSSSSSDSSVEEKPPTPSLPVNSNRPKNPLTTNPLSPQNKPTIKSSSAIQQNTAPRQGNPLAAPENPPGLPKNLFQPPNSPLGIPPNPFPIPNNPVERQNNPPLATPKEPLPTPEMPMPTAKAATPVMSRVTPKKPITPKRPMIPPENLIGTSKKPTITSRKPVVTPEKPMITPQKPVIAPHNPIGIPEIPTIAPHNPIGIPEIPTIAPKKPTATPEKPLITPKPTPYTMPPVLQKPINKPELAGIANALDAVILNSNVDVPQLIRAIKKSKGPGTLDFRVLINELSSVYLRMLKNDSVLSGPENFIQLLVETLIASLEIIRAADNQCIRAPLRQGNILKYIEALNEVLF